jgi:arylsulfatase A-like enzyme
MDEAEKPFAAMLKDLKERGLLDDTIVILTGEFGRTSYCEGPLSFATYGRDHNQLACSILLAGGGFKRGFAYGGTDDYGWSAVDKPVHVRDIQATVLHLLGLDHLKLVHRYQGRDFRLTDVSGNVLTDVLA